MEELKFIKFVTRDCGKYVAYAVGVYGLFMGMYWGLV
jgi:hypothetical protein